MSIEDIRKSLQDVVRYLSEHPAEARYTDSPAVAILEEGLRCRVQGPKGQVVTDMPPAVGGGGAAPSPGWLLRAAQASCDATLIAMEAARDGVTLTTLEVTVDSESDDRGLLGMDEAVSPGPLNSRTRIRVAAPNVSPEHLRMIVKRAEGRSPVRDAVARAIPMTVEVEIL
jgi:uncharacterized OsmC-like protein